MRGKLWIFLIEPLTEIVCNARDFIFGILCSLFYAKAPNIDLQRRVTDESKIGVQIGIFVKNPFFTPLYKQIHKRRNRFLCAFLAFGSDDLIDARIDKRCLFLYEKLHLIQIELMCDI